MFSRKLNTLKYGLPFDIKNENDFHNLVYWLENMKIRFYPPDGRNDLLPGNDLNKWNTSFNKYLDEIGYTSSRDDRKRVIDYLINIALQYELEDTRNQLNMSREQICNMASSNTSENLSRIDVNSSEFIDGLGELSTMMNVPFYREEPLITLRAIAILLRRQTKNSLAEQDKPQTVSDCKRKKLSDQVDENVLKKTFSNSTKYDPSMNRAANVLRLLYINDLRELQTQINSIIVQVQSMTANPKTDTTLGKVGS